MDEVVVVPNVHVTLHSEPVPTVRTTEQCPRTSHQCSRRHERQTGPPSRRQVRVSQAVNFLLYGITLLIPGIAMIIVYFVVFRIPAGDIEWSPADAFVITGSILVGFSILSEFIGLWQFCMSRYESDEPDTTATSATERIRYSDSPPSYNTVAVDLPDLVISVAHDSDENPPSFQSCIDNNRTLPGLDNQAFDGFLTDEDDLPPPPSYPGSLKRKKSRKGVPVFLNRSNGSVKFTSNSEMQPKDST